MLPAMRHVLVASSLLGVTTTGCAGHSCCKNCCLVAGAVGAATAVGFAFGAIDRVIDPEPTNTDTEAGQRKHWEWEQRQLEDSLPTSDF